MGTILASIALVFMIGYMIYILYAKSTLKSQTYKMYMAILLIVWCLITAITYLFEDKTGSFCVWIFNAIVWCLNYHLNKKQYDSINESNKWFEKNDNITGRTTWSTTMEKEPTTNIFKSMKESFMNWLKK